MAQSALNPLENSQAMHGVVMRGCTPSRLRILGAWLLFGLLAALAIGANPFRGQTSSPVDLLASYPAWGSVVAKADVRHGGRSDALDARLPQWTYARNELRQGRLPLWNDTSAGGDAALLKPTSGLLSPAFAVFALAPGAALGFYLSVLLNLTLAGTGMYFFLRQHVDRLPAAFGAVMFQFSGFIVAWLFWSHTLVIIWAPWMLLAVHATIVRPRPAAVAGLGLATAMVLLGGFPFVSLLVGGAAGLYALLLAPAVASRQPAVGDFIRRVGSGLLPAAAGVGLGLLLAAIPLAVFVDWLSQFNTSGRASGSPLRLDHDFVRLFQALAFDEPRVESAMYVGTLGVVFALAGFATVGLKRAGAFLPGLFAGVLWLVAMVLVFELVPKSVVGMIPGLSGNAWSRAISILGLAMSISAAVFLHKMTMLLRHRRTFRDAPFGVVLLALFCFQSLDQVRYFRLFNGPADGAHFYPRTEAIEHVATHRGPFDHVIADNTHLVSGTLGAYGIREWFAHRFRSEALRQQLANLADDPFTTPTASVIRPTQMRLDADEMAAMNIRYLMVGAKSGLSRSVVGVRGSPPMQALPDLPASGPWVQPFQLARPFAPEALKIRFATHQATDLDGAVEVAIRAPGGGRVASMSVMAADIQDNRYLELPITGIDELPAGGYALEVVYRPGSANRPLTAWAAADDGSGALVANGAASGLRLDFVLTSRRRPAHFRKVLETPEAQVWENTRSPNGPYFVSNLDVLPEPGDGRVHVEHYTPGAFTIDYRGPGSGYVVVPMQATRDWTVRVDGRPVDPVLWRGVMPAVPVDAAAKLEFRYRPAALGWVPAWLLALSAIGGGLAVWHRRQRRMPPAGGHPAGGAASAESFPWLRSRATAGAALADPSTAVPAVPPKPLPRPLPRSVWVVTAVWICLMATWSLLLPVYRSADEAWHVGAVRHLQDHREWPGLKEMRLQREVAGSMLHAGLPNGPMNYPRLLAGDAVPRADRPSFAVAGEDSPPGPNNQMTQHPPGYYIVAAAATAVIPSAWRFDLFVFALRLFGVALMAALPLLAALAARRLGADRATMTAAALVPLCIPQLAATSGAVNNDSLLNIASAVVILGAIFVATGDRSYRTACWFGAALAVALLSKAWALLLVPFVVLAFVLAAWRTRAWKPLAGPAVVVGLFSLCGAAWWFNNLATYGTLQPAGHVPLLPETLDFADKGRYWLGVLAERLPTRFWATLSIRPDVPFPYWLTRGASLLLLAALALLLARRRSFDAGRGDACLLAGPCLLGLAVLLESTWTLFATTGIPAGIQGRYLYFSMLGIATGVALALSASLPARIRGWLPFGLWAVFVAFAGASQLKVLTAHWGTEGASLSERWAAWTAWAPAPPWFIATTLVVLLLGVALVPLALARDRHERPAC